MTEKKARSSATNTSSTGNKPVNKIGSLILAAILAILLALWMLSGQFGKKPEVLTEKHRVEEAQALSDVQVRRFSVQPYRPTIALTGETAAARSVTIRAETTGVVKAIHFTKGDSVQQGQLLVTLDSGTSAIRIEQAKTQVERERLFVNSIDKLIAKGLSSQLEQADAKNRLASARVQLSTARDDYSKSRISVPFAGILVHQYVELGDFVSSGTSLFDLADISPTLVRVRITQKELAAIQNQTPDADVVLSTGEHFKATMSYLSPISEATGKTFVMDFAIDTQGNAIQLGLSAKVIVELAPIEAVAISPALLLLDNDGNPGLKYVDQNNRVDYVPVTIVQANSDETWVTGDNLANKDFIVTGQGFVFVGDTVVAHSALTTHQEGEE